MKQNEQNWPRYWNGKRWVSGTAAALHYIKNNTESGHFRGLLEETAEDAIKTYKDMISSKIEETQKPKLERIK